MFYIYKELTTLARYASASEQHTMVNKILRILEQVNWYNLKVIEGNEQKATDALDKILELVIYRDTTITLPPILDEVVHKYKMQLHAFESI